jgi:predicted SAM-dependent methyltransferase
MNLYLGSGLWKKDNWYNHGDTKSLWYSALAKYGIRGSLYKSTRNKGSNNDDNVRFNYDFDYDFDLSEKQQFPISNNKLQHVYTSHLIEHLTNSDVQFLFNNVYRMLNDDGVFRITCPDIEILYDGIFQENKNLFNTPWVFYGLDRDSLSNVDEFLWCSFSYFSESLKIFDEYLIEDMNTYNDFLNINKISDSEFYDLEKKHGKYGTFEIIRKRSELIYPKFKYQMTGLHINWWNKHKVINFLINAGFEKIFVREKNVSVSKEFRSNSFDTTVPEMSLFIEVVK